MAEEKRLNRFTKEEEELIKITFKDNEPLLRTLRKFLLQLPMNAVELSLMETNFKSKELLKVLRRRLLPEVEGDLPFSTLTKQVDQFTVIPMNQLIPENAVAQIRAMDLFRRYMNQQLEVLEDERIGSTPKKVAGHQPELQLKEMSNIEGKDDMDIYLNIFARNQILEQVEQQLLLLDLKANERELNQEELDDMRRKNSNK